MRTFKHKLCSNCSREDWSKLGGELKECYLQYKCFNSHRKYWENNTKHTFHDKLRNRLQFISKKYIIYYLGMACTITMIIIIYSLNINSPQFPKIEKHHCSKTLKTDSIISYKQDIILEKQDSIIKLENKIIRVINRLDKELDEVYQ